MDDPRYTGGMDIALLEIVINTRKFAGGFYSHACFQDN